MPWPTFAYFAYPPQHWLKIKTNNPVERLLKEARRRTKVVGSFPDGNSVLMLVVARLRHVSSTTWDTRKYMNSCPPYSGRSAISEP
ncbi:MAG: transposase [Haliea sp.]|nr:transposase [Haliea sp.]MBK6738338.1 transposase [Haliea sp.]